MSEFNRFERLAAAARRERAPRVDVTGQVMATVASFDRRPAIYAGLLADSPLLAFAGLSLAAAILVGMLAYPAWESV